jgi:hypothetical protein
MIIARATGADSDEILMLGLTRRNIEALLKGFPIRITSETHGAGVPLGWKIMIVFGETERAIAEALKRSGAVGPDTKLMAMPRDTREKAE